MTAITDKDLLPSQLHNHTDYRKRYGDKFDRFMFPVGDVRPVDMSTVKPTPIDKAQRWYVPQDKIDIVECVCSGWLDNGFTFNVGSPGIGVGYHKEVIEYSDDEHGRNRRFSHSTRQQPALIGDCMVWMDIEDPKLALDYMDSHTDIPVVVWPDIARYTDDSLYAKAVDKATEYFIEYYKSGKPKKLVITQEDIEKEMYGL